MMKIIINADDFGLNASVNERILDLIERCCITSATLIANAPKLEDAIRRVPKGSQCSFGVHLNLTEFEPLTPKKDRDILRALLGSNGCFAGEDALRSTKIRLGLRDALFKELRLQVEKILSLGVKVSHFDSHNHVHTMPALFPVLKRLQKYFDVRKVRTTWNIYPSSGDATGYLLLRKRMWSIALRYYYRTTTTSGFTSFAVFYELAKSGFMSHDSVELMVHPGHQGFQEETQLLYTEWQKEIMFPTKLISYEDL